MGITCKPIGKLAGIHRKMRNKQLKTKAEKVNKKSKDK